MFDCTVSGGPALLIDPRTAQLLLHRRPRCGESGKQLHATADGQIAELIVLISAVDETALRRPCLGREKLGDGCVGASAQHAADKPPDRRLRPNQRPDVGRTRTSPARWSSHASASASHRPRTMPNTSRALHDGECRADTIDVGALIERLSASRVTLCRIAERTDSRLDAISPDGSFRFCDGRRTLEQFLASLLKYQGHQVEAVRSALA